MLEKLVDSPILSIAFMIFVIYLLAVYFTNREKSKIQAMKGEGRFQPDWSRSQVGGGRRRRRKSRRRGGSFQPHWNRRDTGGEAAGAKAGGRREGNADPGERDPGEDDPRAG